ncbi:FAD/NAD(P)-binding protein [Alteribacter natronophilus]|uniref:FAD/NAD(P)-binding protein n=1 Tax=Alteribacter natronophilus TaxID=2583810 RepID=UPI00110E268E|nr:FAD/NAD(P)-binding protein [Alteribacter natronophilus]TMW72086.1 lysine N(6)-hydroxylase/L-ornithine N(5)-oxygenase family protein [Alteribacter natronophilus]
MEWLIIGGGIQGCTLASYLVRQGGTDPRNMVIVDPHSSPLKNWLHCTGKIGMTYLRSPFVHHLSPSPFSLESFAKKENDPSPFTGRQKKPKLDLFNRHSLTEFEEAGLMNSWKQGRVTGLKKRGSSWEVTLSHGEIISAKKTAIAIGLGEQPYWPEWARELKDSRPDRIFHVFDRDWSIEGLSGPVTVIGGGITAAHLTLALGKHLPGKVTMVRRHPFRLHEFDSDPGWMGQKYMGPFQRERSLHKRREMIRSARHRGSVPRPLVRSLMNAEREGLASLKQMSIDDVTETPSGSVILSDRDANNTCESETVILATGFEQTPPGMDWLSPLIRDEQLACAQCGYPAVPDNLEWCDHLYVTGGLAELALGPAARNISGARRGAGRIVEHHC